MNIPILLEILDGIFLANLFKVRREVVGIHSQILLKREVSKRARLEKSWLKCHLKRFQVNLVIFLIEGLQKKQDMFINIFNH